MNEIKGMWKHNPFAAAMSLVGAVIILMTIFISDYYRIRNTFFSDIVISGVVVMLTGAWIYIFYSTDRKKPYDETLRLIHESVKNENSDTLEPVEDRVNSDSTGSGFWGGAMCCTVQGWRSSQACLTHG